MHLLNRISPLSTRKMDPPLSSADGKAAVNVISIPLCQSLSFCSLAKPYTFVVQKLRLRKMCEVCFGGPDMVCVPETPMLNVPEAAIVADPLLARFEAAGEEYAESLTLSPETVAALETPMIPKEEYIRQVNGG